MGFIKLRDKAMHDSKVCFKCNTHQPLSEFYKHKMMADGHLNKCKTCAKKDVKDNIEKNIDYYREYDRIRDQLPHRIELKKRYSQTPEGKESKRKQQKKWVESNVIKRSAHIILGNAIRDGRIEKPVKCSICSKTGRIHGHHDDYAFPLTVRWLCPKCHTLWHKENEPING